MDSFTPKFHIGQKVKAHNDLDTEGGEVVAISYTKGDHLGNGDYGYLYTVESKQLNFQQRIVVLGVRTMWEEELVSVYQEEKNES